MNESQADPRREQKARTRAAIVEAARRLQDRGKAPTVAEAARLGGVSRATAYRYFPTQRSLLVEIAEVEPAMVPVEVALSKLETEDVGARLQKLVETSAAAFLAHEADMRKALWVYQDTWLRSGGNPPALRQGRRMRWLDRALEPMTHLPLEKRRRLFAALALTIGMDSLAIMKDVGGLDNEEAVAVLGWAAQVLLEAGLGE
jgi:AcrR family transcriptional regulator